MNAFCVPIISFFEFHIYTNLFETYSNIKLFRNLKFTVKLTVVLTRGPLGFHM